ncbi:MAG TPA: iron uptake transporter deferrochelatase/peroxidase subunit [Thermoleophilaceae bacterium]|jgi:deferrochelatase/peroxidase EfeB
MSRLSRRRFLLGSAATVGGGLAAAGSVALAGGASTDTDAPRPDELAERLPFDGAHQAGILDQRQGNAVFASLDSVAPDRATLSQALSTLSSRARELTKGGRFPTLEYDAPPADSGTLGTNVLPDSLTVTIGFGASLFDHRYGLGKNRPQRLTTMPTFPNDDLDPAQSHGDLLLQLCAHEKDTVVHALRELVRPVRGALQLRWTIDGFTGAPRGPSPKSTQRNLFGFRDGTANPDVRDRKLMNQLVWVQPGAGEPAWATGGTYHVVRIIRMHVEFWDRVGLQEQETMIGRSRDSGAPLGGTNEFQDPRFDLDPRGNRIPLDAHIRKANPRTNATADQRILRRGFSYHRGFDEAGQLDQGLVFVAFNQDIERQFATIQKRLKDEPMVDYVTPVGGGYFFAPRGAHGGSDWVGSGLFAA